MLCQPCDNHCLKSEPVYDFDDMPDIINYACEFFNISVSKIIGNSRERNLVVKRHMIESYLYSIHFPLTLIGKYFNRHHTSVIYGRDSILDMCSTDNMQHEKYRVKAMYDKFVTYMKTYDKPKTRIVKNHTANRKPFIYRN